MMPRICYLEESGLGADELETFVREVDEDFVPPLSQRVDLSSYAEKLYREAVNVVALDPSKDRIVGCSSFYCTPGEYDIAFLSFIGVSKAARGHSLGTRLMEAMVTHVAGAGMVGLETQTWAGNRPMIGLLNRFGFQCVDTAEEMGKRVTARFLLRVHDRD